MSALVQCDEDDPEQAHNALLLAQAPRLLAALKAIVAHPGEHIPAELMIAAECVIAAAEGPRA